MIRAAAESAVAADEPVLVLNTGSGLKDVKAAISDLSDGQFADAVITPLVNAAGGGGTNGLGFTVNGQHVDIGAFVSAVIYFVIFVAVAIALTPENLPKLLVEMGLSQRSMSDPNAMVWAIQQEGNYYCSGSVLAGRQPGEFMRQSDALTQGYQPATGHYCDSGTGTSGAPNGSVSFYLQQLGESGGRVLSKFFSLSRSILTNS